MMWRLVFIAAVSAEVATSSVKLTRQNLVNKVPSSGNMDIAVTRSVLGCAKRCSEHNSCDALFFVQGTGVCQRHSVRYTNTSSGLVDMPSTVYFEKNRTCNSTSSSSTSTASSTPIITTIPTKTSTQTSTSTTTPTLTTTVQITSTTTTIPTVTTTPVPTTTSQTTTTTCVPTPFTCPLVNQSSFIDIVLPECSETFSFRIFNDEPRAFLEAKTKCADEGGKLITVLTHAKMDFLLQLVNCSDYTNLDFLINGVWNNDTSAWETTEGIPLPMSQGDFWTEGRPNVDLGMLCVGMITILDHLWTNGRCDFIFTDTICELL